MTAGKPVSQDRTDEPAEKLLERIRADRDKGAAQTQANRKSRSKRKRGS